MNTYLIKPTLWAGLVATALSITGCQNLTSDSNLAMVEKCSHIKGLKEGKGVQEINIEYDQANNKFYVPDWEKTRAFLKGDELHWKVNTNKIKSYQIKFEKTPGRTDCPTSPNTPKKGPCLNLQNTWPNGQSVKTPSDESIVCKTKPNATPPGRFSSLDYCYTIYAWIDSDITEPPDIEIDPVGSGGGCSGCHANENFF